MNLDDITNALLRQKEDDSLFTQRMSRAALEDAVRETRQNPLFRMIADLSPNHVPMESQIQVEFLQAVLWEGERLLDDLEARAEDFYLAALIEAEEIKNRGLSQEQMNQIQIWEDRYLSRADGFLHGR